MQILLLPEFFIWAVLAAVVLVWGQLLRWNRDTLAWVVFFLAAFPALATIFALREIAWSPDATQRGQAMVIAELVGSYAAVSIFSLVGLLARKPTGMLVALLILANLPYISSESIYGPNLPVLPALFASLALAVIYELENFGYLPLLRTPSKKRP